MISDHAFISANYYHNNIINQQRFFKFRDNKLLNKYVLNEYVNNCDCLNSVFNYTDPNIIATIITEELSNIVEIISPQKIIQVKNNNAPWANNIFKEEQKVKDSLYRIALQSKNENDWRVYKNQRNKVNRLNNKLKYN